MSNSRYSLGANKRIKSSDLVSYTLRKGQRKVSGCVRLHYLPITGGQVEIPKISTAAFIVPKRIYRKASQRNQIRRWMKEAYRINQELILSSDIPSLRLIFIVQKKGIVNFQEVQQSMVQLLAYLSSIQSMANS